jgi:hypothetical protein
MNTARRIYCHLPVTLKSLCETGCVYREPAFKHLSCPIAVKTECAAPCYPEPCGCSKPRKSACAVPCYPNDKMDDTKRQKHKYYHEVYTL